MLVVLKSPDVGADLSREIEYQTKRGHKPTRIEIAPEAHEALRLAMKAPRGAVLTEHDGLPVTINRKFIGIKAWRVFYTTPQPVTERMRDAARGF